MRVGLFSEAPEHGGAADAPVSVLPLPKPESASALDTGWRAELTLEIERRAERSVVGYSRHLGPLRIQRAFYPEGDEVCHLYVLHPPGGIASTDTLHIDLKVGSGACALVTTPGAGKLYRSRGLFADVSQTLTVAAGARLEWFPQEMIAFAGAEARLSTRIDLAADAVYAGWEILCLGRPACGERFVRGRIVNEVSLLVEGQLRFMERADFVGDDPVLTEAWGLAGAPVLGTFVIAHPSFRSGLFGARAYPAASTGPLPEEALIDALRENIEAREGLFAVTLVSGLLIGRYLGRSTLDARACFERMFALARPHYAGRVATPPRIWRT
jgi:urease accessory protein